MLRKTPFIIALVALIALSAITSDVTRSYAQDSALNEVLVLSDTNPRIDVQVEIPQGTQGSLRLELIDASVSVANAANELVLTASSSAIREIEILFRVDSPAHTITIQRLPGVVTGYVRVTATPELSVTGLTTSTTPIELTPEQSQALIPLDFSVVAVGMVEIDQVDNPAYVQIFTPDANAILALYSPATERVRVTLTTGSYQLQMNNVAPYPTLQAQVDTAPLAQTATLMQPVAVTSAPSSAATCVGTVNFERVNQRSGPGTDYTITGDAPQGTVLSVGGWNAARDWLLVGTDYGSAWMYSTYLDLTGDCTNLPVY
jgi:hypothetical protein